MKKIVLTFFVAVLIYAISYWAIEYRRTRLGPWQVDFVSNTNLAKLVINEPALGITNFTIQIPVATTNSATNISLNFAQPQPVPFALPFGECIFEDTTFQPGTLVFNIAGHEIQLLPRVLTVDQQEIPWQTRSPILLNTTNTFRGVP